VRVVKRREGRLGALAERDFRLLFLGRTISLAGSALAPVALAFAVVDLTGSPSDLGLVLAAFVLPQLAFVLVGGIWADRLPRHLVMIVSDLVSGAVQGSIALLLLTGTAQIWHLVVLAAVRGTAGAFFFPASTGVVPETVSAGRLQQANALLGLSRNGTTIGGAALGGLLVAGIGPGWTLAVDAATFGLGAIFLGLLSLPPGSRLPERHFVRELVEGWNEFRSRTWLWAMVVQFAIINATAVSAFLVLGPFIAERSLGGAAAWGAILSAQAAGLVVGGLLGLRYRPEHPLLTATLAFIPTAAPLALLALTAPLAAIAIAAFLAGLGMELFNVLWQTTVQEQIPEDKLSRVSSYDWLGSLALAPVGAASVGPVAEAVGTSETLWAAAAVVVVACLAVLAVADVRNVRRRTLELDVGPDALGESALIDEPGGGGILDRVSH
jgi:MFS family permease